MEWQPAHAPAEARYPARLLVNRPELDQQSPGGVERFRKYLPKDRTFVNTIEDYPYPYVIGGLCWEFPCRTPIDWEAQHLQTSNNPLTVGDWKAAVATWEDLSGPMYEPEKVASLYLARELKKAKGE